MRADGTCNRPLGRSPARRQVHLQPARAGGDLLSRVLGSPALDETDADGVDVDGAGGEAGGLAAAVWKLQDLGAIEDVEAEAGWYSINQQRSGLWLIQGGRVDENRAIRPIVRPYTVRLLTER